MTQARISPLHARYAEEYLIDLNRTAAYRRARAANEGQPARTLPADRSTASLVHRRPEVQERIRELTRRRSERTGITADRVLEEYGKLAFFDPRQFFDAGGELLDISKLPPEAAAALTGMDVAVVRLDPDEDGKPKSARVRRIKFADKKGALDSLAKHLGLFVDKVEVTQKREVELPESLRKLLAVYDD
jgi:phage terminase small subunit